MKIKIESYSVIYSIDGEDTESHEPYNLDLWQQTEDSESDHGVSKWKHKKFVALLTPEQFREFVDNQGLYAEKIETMGSLGAPGYEGSWSPAISFTAENYDIQNAYVTPNISAQESEKLEQKYGKKEIWEAIRKQVIEEYGI